MLRIGNDEGEVSKRSVSGNAAIVLRGRTVPLVNLGELLAGNAKAASLTHIDDNAYVVIIGYGEKQVGLCVDGLVGEQEVVIKSLGKLLGDIGGLSGATILADGSVALIIDPVRALECLSDLTELNMAKSVKLKKSKADSREKELVS
jgi:chemotaxis protein histidine kinase CheA